MNKLIQKFWLIIAIFIIFIALISSVFRALTPWASGYKSTVEKHLSQLLGESVTIKSMETGWYWFAPVIKLDSVSIKENQAPPITLNKIYVGINIWSSLWHWQIQPGVLYIDQVHLVLKEKEGHWNLEGFGQTKNDKQVSFSPASSAHIVEWLSQQDKVVVKRVSANLFSEKGESLYLRDIHLILSRTGTHYRLRGKISVAQPVITQDKTTNFKIMADLNFNPQKWQNTKGSAYISAQNVLIDQFQILFPESKEFIQKGLLSGEFWVDFSKGKFTDIQSQIDLIHSNIKDHPVDLLKANLAWKPQTQGWTLSGDKLFLNLNQKEYPENKFLLIKNTEDNSLFFYIANLDLETITSLKKEWPLAIKPLVDANVHGQVNDLQIKLVENNIKSLLFSFEKLGWRLAQADLSVDNLSGALNYKPDTGRLHFDSTDTTIKFKKFPAQNLTLLNAAITWKLMDASTHRINIERLEVSKADLGISLLGTLDILEAKQLGYIRLAGKFSAADLQKNILPYLPEGLLKPNLLHWIQTNIKRAEHLDGKINVSGNAKDFPFDITNNGAFNLEAQAQGIDMHITPKWPLVKDIKSVFKLDKRNLGIDILEMNLQGVPVQNVHLQIDDLGKDKEVLIVDGKAKLPISNMMDFIKHSPLIHKISVLKKITMDGAATITLNLSAALYPENDDVIVDGTVDFDNNNVILKQGAVNFNLSKFNGDLHFDQQGILESTLYATWLDTVLDITLASQKKPQPHTLVTINSNVIPLSTIKKQIKSPLLAFIDGEFSTQTKLVIGDRSKELDSIQIKSNLEGLAIRLPPPFNKTANTITPLTVDMAFKNKSTLNVKANLADKVRSDLVIDLNQKEPLRSVALRVGKSHATQPNLPGFQVVGTFNEFNVEEWRKALSPISAKSNDNDMLKSLSNVDVFIHKLVAFKRVIPNIGMKITPGKKDDWAIKIRQKDIQADLQYSPHNYSLAGYFTHLYLSKSEFKGSNMVELRPEEIPNLNLRIDGLQYDNLKIGDVTFNTKSSPSMLEIKYFKIQTPHYTINVEGSWHQKGKNNSTDLQVQMLLSNLEKSLENWGITPAVSASRGEVKFQGGWKAPIYDYSLPAIYGSLYIGLKKGRITDLSPEMEQKLGLGKLLSVLSLQTLPRRLTLDFSDLSKKGYSFDIFEGTFSLKNGVMNTKNSYIDGPVAYASMKGDLDLVRKLYNVELNVVPHITASLPIVATIAGGPIAGIAAWVAGKIINQGMQKISAYSYRITGPWHEPIVEQLKIIKTQSR